MKNPFTTLYRRIMPTRVRRYLTQRTHYPYTQKVNLGHLNRTEPISRVWGLDRGLPVDRYYITQFLKQNGGDVRGHVLEVGGNAYTLRYGAEMVQKSDILHVSPGDSRATIIADLTDAGHIPTDTFDCMICTQTLHLIFQIERAIETIFRILKPGGVLLATLPGISQISRYDMDRWGDYWRFTSASASQLFGKHFSTENVHIQVFGNVLAATGFLQGLAVEDISTAKLDVCDPDYELLIGVRAVKGCPAE